MLTLIILATIVAFIALFVESVRGFGETTADVLTVPYVGRGMNHDQRRRAWFALPKHVRMRWMMAKPMNYRLHNQVLLTIAALLVLGLTGLFIFKAGIAGVSLAMASPIIGGNMKNRNLTEERKSKVAGWISGFMSKWANPDDKNAKIIRYARDNNSLNAYQNGVTGSIELEIPRPKDEVVFFNHKMVPSKERDENGKPLSYHNPTVEVSGIGMAAVRSGAKAFRIKVDESNPGRSIATFIQNLNDSRTRRGMKILRPTFQKTLLSQPVPVQKWNGEGFDTIGHHNGIFFLGETDVWTRAISKNRYIAKGMVWFVQSEKERKAYKAWAQMLCDWSIDNDKTIENKEATKKIAALMIKKADFLTDFDTIKGPFFEGEAPRWRDIIKNDPKLLEYLGYKTIATIQDREYTMFPLPTDAIQHFYGVESVFMNSMVCMKKGLIPKFASAYWSARRNELPKKLQSMLIDKMGKLVANNVEEMINAIAEIANVDDVFGYIRYRIHCPLANRIEIPETMTLAEAIERVYHDEMKTLSHNLTQAWFEKEIRTSASQFVMYNVHPAGDNTFAGRFYLRDVANTKGSPSISPQWIGRNTWKPESEAAFIERAKSVKNTLADRIALATAASENSDVADFVPDWARVALSYGNTYDMMGAPIHVLNRLNTWDGVKGPELPAILYDVETDSILVDVDSDMVYLAERERGVYDFQSCVHGGDPVIEENETINGFSYRVPGNKVRAIRRSIKMIDRAHDDCDGDFAKLINKYQGKYWLEIIESSAGTRIVSPDKSLTPEMPERAEGESKEKYGDRVFAMHLERICNVPIGRASVAGWDTLYTAFSNLKANVDIDRPTTEKVVGKRLQGAVQIKVQPEYGFMTASNIENMLKELGIDSDGLIDLAKMYDCETDNVVGRMIGMGSQISKIVGGRKVANRSFLNDDLKAIRSRLFKTHGLEDGKVIFDNLYEIYAMIEAGNSLARTVDTWKSPLVHKIIEALAGGLKMHYSVEGERTLCMPLMRKEFFGWKWLAGFKEIAGDNTDLVGFMQYFPQGVINFIRNNDENRAEAILAMRDAIDNIADLVVSKTGADMDRVRHLIAWSLLEVSATKENKGFRYLPIALMKDQVLALAEMIDARFSLFTVNGRESEDYVNVEWMIDENGILGIEY